MATTSPDRILSLDLIRGVAVMGIFSVNVVGMAMIENAYFYPPDYGFHALGDRIMWAANFILVDGKFRSLFSMLFGASMVLVIERSIAAGKEGWKVHYARMAGSAAVRPRAFLLPLVGRHPRQLRARRDDRVRVLEAAAEVAAARRADRADPQLCSGHRRGPAADRRARGQARARRLGGRSRGARRAHGRAAPFVRGEDRRGPQGAHHARRAPGDDHEPRPPVGAVPVGARLRPRDARADAARHGRISDRFPHRKLATQALRAGRRGVRRPEPAAISASAPGASSRPNFDPFVYFPWDQIYSGPLHPVAAVGYAALVILLLAGRRTALGDRIAAVGRAAFTNYLGSTIVGMILFFDHGFGLYGELSRGEAWLIVPVRLGADAAVVEMVARPLPLRPVRMGLAQPGPVGVGAAAASVRRRPSAPAIRARGCRAA